MALSYVDVNGKVTIPGSYPSIKVEAATGGLATTGVIMLIGEAATGPDYSSETDFVNAIGFGPDQFAQVVAKYGSGPLVDAFKYATNASNDPSVAGSPNLVYLLKTNKPGFAQAALGSYASLVDKKGGTLGNLLSAKVEQAAEVAPVSEGVAFNPTATSATLEFRVNGGAAVTHVFNSASDTPASIVTTFNAAHTADSVQLKGGADRGVASGITALSTTITLAAVGQDITISLTAGAWTAAPVVGDTLLIATGSGLAGTGSANVGNYLVTAVGTGSVTARRLNAGTPVAVSAVSAVNDMFRVYAPLQFFVSSAAAAGVGQSLEIRKSAGTGQPFYKNDATLVAAPAAWSDTGSALFVAAAEPVATVTVARPGTNTLETFQIGGAVGLKVGYLGTTATVAFNGTTMTLTGVGGANPGAIVIKVTDFATVNDLVAYIGSQAGWAAAVGSALYGQLNPAIALDEVTASCATSVTGSTPARIKMDANDFAAKLTNSAVVSVPVAPTKGLPAVQAVTYFTGGSKGATTDANVTGAVNACERLRGNFLVTCFSQDASADKAAGLTEAGSTYTISAINAAVQGHVAKMSTFKRRRARQGFVSVRGTFAQAKLAAQNLAAARVACAFQDVKAVNAQGSIQQFQPWMGAVLAAGFQAATFYRPIFNKLVNCSGVLQAAGDFFDSDDSAVEDALQNGLVVLRAKETGGFAFVSDQTTYGVDNNFVYNSIQAIYGADTVALTVARRMEDAFVGQSIADVPAAIALSYLRGIMSDLRRVKLITGSDEAPEGYRNAVITISGPVMYVSVEIKLSTGIYWIPIQFLVSSVQQTAK